MAAFAKFGYVDLDLEVDHEARTLVPPSMPGEEPRESDRPSVLPAAVLRPDSYAPSESGVSAKDDRVGAMRELYEAGDIEAALALGAKLASLFQPEDGEDGFFQGPIGVEDDDESISPFAGLRELQAPLSAAIAADEVDDPQDD